jgi:hypothetical protein
MRHSLHDRLRTAAAFVAAAVIVLSALHGAVPHHPDASTCLACQTLAAPAIVPPAEPEAVVRDSVRIDALRGGVPTRDATAIRLRPLRAPPLLPAA